MVVKFNLNQYTPIPEGEQLLEITKAVVTPSGKPTKAEITFKDSEGRLLTSRYDFNVNGALMAFGFLCRIVFSLEDMDEFDTNDIGKMVGKKVICEIVHTEGTQEREDGTLPVFANIKKVLRLADDSTPIVTEKSPRASIPVGDDLD